MPEITHVQEESLNRLRFDWNNSNPSTAGLINAEKIIISLLIQILGELKELNRTP